MVTRIGKLSLIDLAGSERALATDLRTPRSIEGANINRSLLALSSCINALVEGKRHIPYRNSKLTQLLKDSLGGPCNTVMIANISPNNLSFNETQNTLHWADRAKEIRNKVSSFFHPRVSQFVLLHNTYDNFFVFPVYLRHALQMKKQCRYQSLKLSKPNCYLSCRRRIVSYGNKQCASSRSCSVPKLKY